MGCKLSASIAAPPAFTTGCGDPEKRLVATAFGGRVLVQAAGQKVIVINVRTGVTLSVLEVTGRAHVLAVSEKEGALFASTDIGVVKWDLKSAEIMATLKGQQYGHYGLAISENENALFVCTLSTIQKWDVKSTKLLNTVESGHQMSKCSLAISDKANALFRGSMDGTVERWDLRSLDLVSVLKGQSNWVLCMAISEKDNALFTGSFDGRIEKWDFASSKLIVTAKAKSEFLYCLSISEEENAIFTCCDDGVLQKWNSESFELLVTLEDSISCFAISEETRALITASNDNQIKKWDLASVESLAISDVHSQEITCLAISENDRALFTGSSDSTIKWDLNSLAFNAKVVCYSGDIRCCAVCEKENALFACSATDNVIKKWDLKSAELLATMEGHHCVNWSSSLAYGPCLAIFERQNSLFTFSNDEVIKKFDLKSAELVATRKGRLGGSISNMAISEKESALFTSSSKRLEPHHDAIEKWDLNSAELLATLKKHSGVITCLAVSEKENALFTGSAESSLETGGALKKWDLKSVELLATLKGHSENSSVVRVAISENEGALFTGFQDGTIEKWDLKSAKLMATLKAHSDVISCMVISDKEHALFTASGDKTIKKWNLKSADLLIMHEATSPFRCCMVVDQYSALIASTLDGRVQVLDMGSLELVWEADQHGSEAKQLMCTSDGVVLSRSTKILAFTLADMYSIGVVSTTTYPEPGWSAETRLLPRALFAGAVGNKVVNVCQLTSFAFRRNAMPSSWVPPARAIQRIADLGIPIEDVHEFNHIFLAVLICVWCFLLFFVSTGNCQLHVFLHPDEQLARYSFLTLGCAFKFLCGAAFLPVIKVLLWPLVAWDESEAFQIVVGVMTAAIFALLTFRLTRVDIRLECIGRSMNLCDWSRDLCRMQRTLSKKTHSLSLKSPMYDLLALPLKLLALSSSLALSRLPDIGVTVECMQICIGIALFLAAWHCEPYYRPFPGGLDQNALQAGMDAGLVAIYAASLVAVVASNHLGPATLDALWLIATPLLAFPIGAFAFYRRRRRVQRAVAPRCDGYALLTPRTPLAAAARG